MKRNFTIGSRGSRLALWQTEFIKNQLKQRFPAQSFDVRIIKTTGDAILDTALSKIGDKGLFTRQIETALIDGEIDLAVHSLKDLPTVQPSGLSIAAVSRRETPNDVLISEKYASLDDLPPRAKVATGSLRRRSQLLSYRADLEIVEIRGNVPTRIEKFLAEPQLDAMILAYAGVHRLNLDKYIKQVIPTEILLPAVGQGVMAVEIRSDDEEVARMVRETDDDAARACTTAERAFLRQLEGGCQVPIAGFAVLDGAELYLQGFVGNLKGEKTIRRAMRGPREKAEDLGKLLAEKCLQAGAAQILQEARNASQKAAGEVI